MIGTFKAQVILLFEINNPIFSTLYVYEKMMTTVHMEVSTIIKFCHMDLILNDMVILFGILKRREREKRKRKEGRRVIEERKRK